MYGFPENIDLSGIVGDRIDSIGIQEFQVTFYFERGISFVVEAKMEVASKGTSVAQWEQETGWSAIDFQKCVGKTVESFVVASNTKLIIRFSDDWSLIFYDNSSEYESFHIYPQGIHI